MRATSLLIAAFRGTQANPFETPLPARRTKQDRAQTRSRRVSFAPFTAKELGSLVAVLRKPKGLAEELALPLSPKQVSAELGHSTARMVVSVDDSFMDPSRWPGEKERRHLAALYGWSEKADPTSAEAEPRSADSALDKASSEV